MGKRKAPAKLGDLIPISDSKERDHLIPNCNQRYLNVLGKGGGPPTALVVCRPRQAGRGRPASVGRRAVLILLKANWHQSPSVSFPRALRWAIAFRPFGLQTSKVQNMYCPKFQFKPLRRWGSSGSVSTSGGMGTKTSSARFTSGGGEPFPGNAGRQPGFWEVRGCEHQAGALLLTPFSGLKKGAPA